mgnify:CR=1 FL=1
MTQNEFKTLFDTYFNDVRKYIFYRSGDEDLATDIAQETFMRVWEKQFIIDHRTIKGLLYKIANDFFVSSYRKEKVAFNFFKNFQPAEHELSPEEEVNYIELKNAYERSLETMPEKQRTVFLMSRVDELKYKEIADQLGLSVKAIEKRMNLALEHLRINLKNQVNMVLLIISSKLKLLR